MKIYGIKAEDLNGELHFVYDEVFEDKQQALRELRKSIKITNADRIKDGDTKGVLVKRRGEDRYFCTYQKVSLMEFDLVKIKIKRVVK